MNLDILSLNLILYVCILFSVLTFYLVTSLYKSGPEVKPRKKKDKQSYARKNQSYFVSCLAASLLLGIIIWLLCEKVTDSPIPFSFVLMVAPFTFMLCLLGVSIFIKHAYVPWVCGTLVLGLVFSLLLVNNYYRYDPTLGMVFGDTNTTSYRAELNSVTVHYTVALNQQKYNEASVQGSLENLASQPTAGKLYQINIPGTVSHFKARSGYVYIPAIYNSGANVNLPVIVLTAGIPGTPANWVGLGLQNIMDNFAASHDGITPLVFVADSTGSVNNDTECVNSPRGNAETYLSVDVPNYIKSNFRVDTSPKNWAIGGLSLGGMCSIMLTLRHPNVYNYFMDLGGEIGPEDGSQQYTIASLFGGSYSDWQQHQPLTLLAENKYKGLGGYFGDGLQDSRNVVTALQILSQESKKVGVNTVTETINGAHTFNVWAQTYKDGLPWISNRIGATQCSSSCI
ncbi:MAG TPA: alpha/beta hydrolase-fold protein [Candidatus Sulfotelmatobacter sp.]|nr:alpha/beta hydrolase-fold protein [Candidatus Sulfotelmatobacter sp.]